MVLGHHSLRCASCLDVPYSKPATGHILDMTRYGLGWGTSFSCFHILHRAAIPFAFRAKWKRSGMDTRRDLKDIGERFLMLLAFSFLCNLLQPSLPGYWSKFLILAGFGALWLIYVKGASLKTRIAGWVTALALLVLYAFAYDVQMTLFSRNIIILLLAFLYLFGALIWYFTRDNVKWRLAAFLGVIAISIVSRFLGFDGSFTPAETSPAFEHGRDQLPDDPDPATWVGDRLLTMQEEHDTGIPRGGFTTLILGNAPAGSLDLCKQLQPVAARRQDLYRSCPVRTGVPYEKKGPSIRSVAVPGRIAHTVRSVDRRF